jgi:hypothetical protein
MEKGSCILWVFEEVRIRETQQSIGSAWGWTQRGTQVPRASWKCWKISKTCGYRSLGDADTPDASSRMKSGHFCFSKMKFTVLRFSVLVYEKQFIWCLATVWCSTNVSCWRWRWMSEEGSTEETTWYLSNPSVIRTSQELQLPLLLGRHMALKL